MIGDRGRFSLDGSKSAFLQIRLRLKLSRRQFGRIVHVDEDTVGAWERGKYAPRLSIAQIKAFTKLLTSLGLTWDDIPDNVGPPLPPVEENKDTNQE